MARCTGTADVLAAVDVARDAGALLSVKGGGHDYAGNSRGDGGLLGGGSGFLHRKYGLALDNLLAADVVTAGGERVRASEDENPDLFWALRGGGGNFGVVTSMDLRLHGVGPTVLAGQIFHPYEAAAEVLRHARDLMSDPPDELQCYPFLLRVPPLALFPAEQHGRIALDLVVAWAGSVEEGEEALGPLREFGDPYLDLVQPQPFTALQQSFDAGMPPGHRWYSRARYLTGIPDELVDRVVERVDSMPGAFSVVYFEPLGGAVSRVDPSAAAFPHRDAPFGIHIVAGWTDPGEDEEITEWARSFHEELEPYSTGGVYVNLLSPDQEEGVRAAYGRHLERLKGIKAEWDPENLFRVNHNIAPAG